jgi:hypothetical protein
MTVTLNAGTFTDTKDSSGATAQTSDPVPPCAQAPQIPFVTGVSNTIWYKFAPSTSGTITDVDTIGTSYDSVLSIWTGSAGTLTEFACNDDINPGILTQSQLTNLGVTAGTTYYIMVSSFGPADPNPVALGGKTVFNFQFTSSSTTTPSITSLTPNSGPVGTSVTIAGTNFGATQGTSTVTFSGTAATPTSWSASSIVVPVPAGATTGNVIVTVGGVASNGVVFTVTSSDDRDRWRQHRQFDDFGAEHRLRGNGGHHLWNYLAGNNLRGSQRPSDQWCNGNRAARDQRGRAGCSERDGISDSGGT